MHGGPLVERLRKTAANAAVSTFQPRCRRGRAADRASHSCPPTSARLASGGSRHGVRRQPAARLADRARPLRGAITHRAATRCGVAGDARGAASGVAGRRAGPAAGCGPRRPPGDGPALVGATRMAGGGGGHLLALRRAREHRPAGHPPAHRFAARGRGQDGCRRSAVSPSRTRRQGPPGTSDCTRARVGASERGAVPVPRRAGNEPTPACCVSAAAFAVLAAGRCCS